MFTCNFDPCSMVAYTYAVRGTIESVFFTVPTASAEFHETLAYAHSCVGRQDLTLTVKPKQEEALVVVEHI